MKETVGSGERAKTKTPFERDTKKSCRDRNFKKAERDPRNQDEKEVRWRKEERKTEPEAQGDRETERLWGR